MSDEEFVKQAYRTAFEYEREIRIDGGATIGRDWVDAAAKLREEPSKPTCEVCPVPHHADNKPHTGECVSPQPQEGGTTQQVCLDEACDHKQCWDAAKKAVADRRQEDFRKLHPKRGMVTGDAADLLYSRNKWHMLCDGLGWPASTTSAALVLDAIATGQEENAQLKRLLAPQPQEGGTCTDCELPLPSCKCNVDATAVNEAATPSLSPEMATALRLLKLYYDSHAGLYGKNTSCMICREVDQSGLLDALEGKSQL